MIRKPPAGSFLYINTLGRVEFSMFTDNDLSSMFNNCKSGYIVVVRICRRYEEKEENLVETWPEVEVMRGGYVTPFYGYLNEKHSGWRIKVV